jgi:hypothetical protein
MGIFIDGISEDAGPGSHGIIFAAAFQSPSVRGLAVRRQIPRRIE